MHCSQVSCKQISHHVIVFYVFWRGKFQIGLNIKRKYCTKISIQNLWHEPIQRQ